jgi:Tfp pilus assembly pilus retraction ATPase PilT
VRNTIREARTHQLRNLILTGRQAGMQTLEHHLSELLADRLIERSSAEALSDRHDELRTPAPVAM